MEKLRDSAERCNDAIYTSLTDFGKITLTFLVDARRDQSAAQRLDQSIEVGAVVRPWWHQAPYRFWPSNISSPARNDVNVKLGHKVADCGGIEFITWCNRFEAATDLPDLGDQLYPIGLVEIEDFNETGPPWHQHKPRIIRIIHEEDARQR
jgi:hypothetical protein